jgi:hypothetical protein
MSGRLNTDHEWHEAICHGLSLTDAVDRLEMQYLEDTELHIVCYVLQMCLSLPVIQHMAGGMESTQC